MDMKHKKLLILWIILSFGLTVNTYAQKVYTDGTRYIFEAEGMPPGSYTRSKRPPVDAGSTNTSAGPNTAANLASKECDKTIAYKFEIAATDEGTTAMDWRSAVDACASKGSDWRLPTLRELILMQIFKNALAELTGFTPFKPSQYWSATEHSSSEGEIGYTAWFSEDVSTGYDRKATAKRNVRCVRDIVSP